MSAVIILLSKSNFYLSKNIFISFIFHENQLNFMNFFMEIFAKNNATNFSNEKKHFHYQKIYLTKLLHKTLSIENYNDY